MLNVRGKVVASSSGMKKHHQIGSITEPCVNTCLLHEQFFLWYAGVKRDVKHLNTRVSSYHDTYLDKSWKGEKEIKAIQKLFKVKLRKGERRGEAMNLNLLTVV